MKLILELFSVTALKLKDPGMCLQYWKGRTSNSDLLSAPVKDSIHEDF